jgi:glycosyltransferase involved in cell wall biosynthesis
VIVALNDDVARRFEKSGRVFVEPNVALDIETLPKRHEPTIGVTRTAVFLGRLVTWKGVLLAVDAIARPEAAGWCLEFYGDGPARKAIEAKARMSGVAHRVAVHGTRPRSEALAALATADALLFPSMHDSSPWSVGEAVTIGCPVICLARGGPPVIIAGGGGAAVKASGDVVGKLAVALMRCGDPVGSRTRWSADRVSAVATKWYQMAAAQPGA